MPIITPEPLLKRHTEDCPFFKIIMDLFYRTLTYTDPSGILFGKTIMQTKFEYCPCCGQRFADEEAR